MHWYYDPKTFMIPKEPWNLFEILNKIQMDYVRIEIITNNENVMDTIL